MNRLTICKKIQQFLDFVKREKSDNEKNRLISKLADAITKYMSEHEEMKHFWNDVACYAYQPVSVCDKYTGYIRSDPLPKLEEYLKQEKHLNNPRILKMFYLVLTQIIKECETWIFK